MMMEEKKQFPELEASQSSRKVPDTELEASSASEKTVTEDKPIEGGFWGWSSVLGA